MVSCKHCGDTFKRKRNLNIHIGLVHNPNAKPTKKAKKTGDAPFIITGDRDVRINNDNTDSMGTDTVIQPFDKLESSHACVQQAHYTETNNENENIEPMMVKTNHHDKEKSVVYEIEKLPPNKTKFEIVAHNEPPKHSQLTIFNNDYSIPREYNETNILNRQAIPNTVENFKTSDITREMKADYSNYANFKKTILTHSNIGSLLIITNANEMDNDKVSSKTGYNFNWNRTQHLDLSFINSQVQQYSSDIIRKTTLDNIRTNIETNLLLNTPKSNSKGNGKPKYGNSLTEKKR
eukprot:GAHX01002371.1.p1 GENE.GAHX01002371.1~~GAHX01002371.1.p1  ORF type:complete len:292 (+),score=46.04 GAHX01002371.1:106-981(+)